MDKDGDGVVAGDDGVDADGAVVKRECQIEGEMSSKRLR